MPKITKEEIPEEEKILEELGQDYLQNKQVEAKKVAATKEWLFSRSTRTYDIEIDVGGEIRVFKARRLSEKERANMKTIQAGLTSTNLSELSPEELELLQKQGHELLATVIVEPKLTVEEWEQVDLALIQLLLDKVSALQVEVNDAKLIEELRNL